MRLSTPRLDLWPCSFDDVDTLHVLWRDPAVRKLLWDDRLISRHEAEQVVRQFVEAGNELGLGLWMLETRAGGEFVGFAALREMALAGEIELFYGLAPQFWGRGFATEAARALLQYAFQVLNLPRIWARTDPPNAASQRVAGRLGMQAAADPGETSYVTFVIERENFTP
jgi:RimJ/RimL family protein N-acetyltransferase